MTNTTFTPCSSFQVRSLNYFGEVWAPTPSLALRDLEFEGPVRRSSGIRPQLKSLSLRVKRKRPPRPGRSSALSICKLRYYTPTAYQTSPTTPSHALHLFSGDCVFVVSRSSSSRGCGAIFLEQVFRDATKRVMSGQSMLHRQGKVEA